MLGYVDLFAAFIFMRLNSENQIYTLHMIYKMLNDSTQLNYTCYPRCTAC